jgi:hypothetical protein
MEILLDYIHIPDIENQLMQDIKNLQNQGEAIFEKIY